MSLLAGRYCSILKGALLVTLCSFLNITSVFAENKVFVIYDKPINSLELKLEEEVRASGVIEDVAEFINEQIALPTPLYFTMGGAEGPLYDSALNKVFMPYTFIQEVKDRFSDAKYSETGVSVADATMDAVMHTLFHELAHALIFTYELPVLGKEEDAADSLASVLLIEYFDNGAEIAISAADLFDLESGDVTEFEEGDFWDEHSLDAQRFYSTMCYVYGSDAQKYESLANEIGFSQDRLELCIEEYENIVRSWFTILKPYFKQN